MELGVAKQFPAQSVEVFGSDASKEPFGLMVKESKEALTIGVPNPEAVKHRSLALALWGGTLVAFALALFVWMDAVSKKSGEGVSTAFALFGGFALLDILLAALFIRRRNRAIWLTVSGDGKSVTVVTPSMFAGERVQEVDISEGLRVVETWHSKRVAIEDEWMLAAIPSSQQRIKAQGGERQQEVLIDGVQGRALLDVVAERIRAFQKRRGDDVKAW